MSGWMRDRQKPVAVTSPWAYQMSGLRPAKAGNECRASDRQKPEGEHQHSRRGQPERMETLTART
jgi:hypothetical protein